MLYSNSPAFRPMLIMGTRPEAIKMAPVVHSCQKSPGIEPIVCFTGQHRELLRQVANYFEITPDVDLDLMRPNQSLAGLTARCLETLDAQIDRFRPNCLVAQGDTTSVLVTAMLAFYRRLPFIHIEAGLRTGDMHSPWPEEYNRRVTSLTTDLHCAPTSLAANNLRAEKVLDWRIHITGNTVVDALLWTVNRERLRHDHWASAHSAWMGKRLVLITLHRRENFGGPLEQVCRAIRRLARQYTDTQFVYPVHPNPNVRQVVGALLSDEPNVTLLEPLDYPEFVWLMDQCTFIISDSGGVQEEAPTLRKPVLLARTTTERPEAVEAGAVQLVGPDADMLVASATRLLQDRDEYRRRQAIKNPFGDGQSADRIVRLIARRAWETPMQIHRHAA